MTLAQISAKAADLKKSLVLNVARKKAIALVKANQAKAEVTMGLTKEERDALWHSNYAPSAMAKTHRPITPSQIAKVAPRPAAPATPKAAAPKAASAPKPTPAPEKRSDDKDGYEVFPRSPKYRLTRAEFNELSTTDRQRFLAAKGTLTD